VQNPSFYANCGAPSQLLGEFVQEVIERTTTSINGVDISLNAGLGQVRIVQ